MNSSELDRIQSLLCYKFKNINRLIAAFTHSSYVNEHHAIGNERLEFIGDCVLNFLVGERLFLDNPTASEGTLSARRSAIVSRVPLARIVDGLGLMEFLRVGAGVDKRTFTEKPRSDLFEAIVGAVYLDGGSDECRALLDRLFYDNVTPEVDYKSRLQEHATDIGLSVIYNVDECPDGFSATVTIGNSSFTAVGRKKQLAEIAAARRAIEVFIKK